MAASAMDVLLKNIEERRETLARALVDGTARDYAEYKAMCGEVRGLSVAHSFITDLVRRLEQDEDE